MELKIQKRLASRVLKTSKSKIKFDSDRLDDIKESITKTDIKSLIIDKAIHAEKKVGQSRSRARKRQEQKTKGKRKGHGSRKGKATARLPKKETWMNHVRKQRKFLKDLRDKELITKGLYQNLYMKSKGGFFRSIRHIKGYVNEKGLIKEDKQKVQ